MPNEEQIIKQLENRFDKKRLNKKLKTTTLAPTFKAPALKTILSSSRRVLTHEDMPFSKVIEYFAALADADRMALWDFLAPKLAPHLESAWQDVGGVPWEPDDIAAPFRAPRSPAVLTDIRAWLFIHWFGPLQHFDFDVSELAAYGPYCAGFFPFDHAGWILAAALRAGGEDADVVRGILVDAINGRHDIAQYSGAAAVALLNSDERSDWEHIGKLLLAAQRQEGLRQSILEVTPQASPDAFRYMLGLVLENGLGRFSSVVQAFDTWFGMQWAGGSAKAVHSGLERMILYLDDANARRKAVASGDPEDAYLALWTTAYADADDALDCARTALADDSPERRYAAVRILGLMPWMPNSLDIITDHISNGGEPDTRIRMAIASQLGDRRFDSVPARLFDVLSEWFAAAPARAKELGTLIWPWEEFTHDRQTIGAAIAAMAHSNPDLMMPLVSELPTNEVVVAIADVAGVRTWRQGAGRAKRKRRDLTQQARQAIISLFGDRRQEVRSMAFAAMSGRPLEDDELAVILGLLHRTTEDLRAAAIKRLSELPDDHAVATIGRLIDDRNAKKRAAGLELAAMLVEANRSADAVRKLVRAYPKALDEAQSAPFAKRILAGASTEYSLEDCFGLVPPESRTTLPNPADKKIVVETPAARACLKQLADLFLKHADTEIEYERLGALKQTTLGNAGFAFPGRDEKVDPTKDAKARLPLAEVWLDWLNARGPETRDSDRWELTRAYAWYHQDDDPPKFLPRQFRSVMHSELQWGFSCLLDWMLQLAATPGSGRLIVQFAEDAIARAFVKAGGAVKNSKRCVFRQGSILEKRIEVAEAFVCEHPAHMPAEARQRLAVMLMVSDTHGLSLWGDSLSLELFVEAYDAGLLNEADLTWRMLHTMEEEVCGTDDTELHCCHVQEATGYRPHPLLEGRPKLLEAARKARDRVIEVELERGENDSPATPAALQIQHVGGADKAFRILTALGKDNLSRQTYGRNSIDRRGSFSRLLGATAPEPGDTPERFTEMAAEAAIKPTRLLEFAMLAPQWAAHAEHALNMPGLEEAVWWIHAHTKNNEYWGKDALREIWEARIVEFTELAPTDLEDGAVDVAWFRRVLDALGPETWSNVQAPAKYACDNAGHKRAQLFAEAMLSQVTADALIKRIDEKRHQDSVRALGLVPLPKGEKKAAEETLRRYKRLQEFKRESRKFGAQRQASEGRAVEIGMENLARTAGYRDPQRLQWSMESAAVADLARGPMVVKEGETTVSLAINDEGEPELAVVKKGKTLKAVPPALRKHTEIAELGARVTELRRQRSRMRLSLEQAMCRGDAFSGDELRELLDHPILRPMLERLVFIGGDDLIGYPDKGGRVLRRHDGEVEVIGKKDLLRIAHSADLLARGDWSAWQSECFAAERVQPFKQVFREVYPKTAAELDKCDFSRRYAGHQVQGRQALALLKQRQWVAVPDEGIRKVFHDQDLVVTLWFQNPFWSPAEVEDLALEGVVFTRRKKSDERVLMTDVPERLFSEVMRDLDLVVSVAHAGGVDPEASASTVEMRARLVDETCRMLRLNNVRVEKNHVKIDGTKSSYTVHLGSAIATRRPGRSLFIVAVHSQYRGRLFLPFADDDPKTAEVLAKTLLLARDEDIRDPEILRQISE